MSAAADRPSAASSSHAGSAAASPAAADPADATPDSRLALALTRLQASRAQLRAAMLPAPAGQHESAGFTLPRRWRAIWRAWTRSGPLALVAGSTMSAMQSWWRRQPWYATTELAGRAVLAETTPLIRRHPVWAVALGVGVGAALVAARPWRWQAVNRHVRPLGQHLVGWALRQLSQVPVQMALAALLAQFVGQRARDGAAAAEPPTPTPAPMPSAAPAPDADAAPDGAQAAGVGSAPDRSAAVH